ncbi:MAG TPA: hypothetical protein VL358_08855 [Caulobacteraceae bacterium]|jgi:hypothetical protein|nr:hypothetical protein [Caulobacteraceae bacterium]
MKNEAGAEVEADAPDKGVTQPNHGGPPQISSDDPVAPATHVVGGAYATADYAPAARRSALRTDLEFDQGRHNEIGLKATFEDAEGQQGPSGP